MKNAAYLLASILLLGGCSATVAHDRYGTSVEVAPVDVWGTVTLVDPVSHRIDLDYVDGGMHRTRSYYYDEHNTRWNDVKYSDLHNGDEIIIHGHNNKDRWEAESVSRHHHDN